MNRSEEASVARARSRDGTEIGCWTSGEGPPLVLVHGMGADHTTWQTLLTHLTPHATVHAVDRRGRGASGDGPDYDLAREFEDIAAVVDAVAHVSGSAVDVLGHSFGGICAFGAATLTANLGKLVLYEGWAPAEGAPTFPPGLDARVDALLDGGDREGALATFIREVLGLSEEELDAFRAAPAWPARVAAVHTLPREMRAESGATLDPEQAARVTVPTLMLVGGDSPDHLTADYEAVAAALPDARTSVLAGQQHAAHHQAPDVIAERVFAFLRDQA